MPELPEVETVVRGLNETVGGKKIRKVNAANVHRSTLEVSDNLRNKDESKVEAFERVLKNKTIKQIKRRGKNILIELSSDITLWAHLKMTGHFFYYKKQTQTSKHDLVEFEFTNDKFSLRFNDYRRFGRLRLYKNNELFEQKGLRELGPEPFDISAIDFTSLFKSKKRMIKPALLDQSIIAGIGNIYADEVLHICKIHPCRLTSSISSKKLIELHDEIQKILRMSIKKMGSSVDTFSGINGKVGTFQKYLKVYGSENKPCQFCGRKIKREKINSRSAHYCPSCQRI